MVARAQEEVHRAATPLELFFDLVFVVAIAQAAGALHHAIVEHHIADGTLKYLLIFFAIWWAWMNFSWFATAYDTDDVPYRLTVFLQLTGALVLAAGVKAAFADLNFTVITLGYVVMRVAMVIQYLRAARNDPPRRKSTLRIAMGVGVLQVGWVGLLFIPASWMLPGFLLLVLAELMVPLWAEQASATTWHKHHIAERYGLLTIIVLGESILAAVLALRVAMDAGSLPLGLVPVIVGGLLIVFSLWWIYFDCEAPELLTTVKKAYLWGYGHYFIFASGAAVGAGLAAAIDHATGQAQVEATTAGAVVAVPAALFLLCVWYLHVKDLYPNQYIVWLIPAAVVLILCTPFTGQGVLLTGLLLAGVVAVNVLHRHRLPATP